MIEHVLAIPAHPGLVAIATAPDEAADSAGGGRLGIALLNAGLVHRAGPNRMYTELARRLPFERADEDG